MVAPWPFAAPSEKGPAVLSLWGLWGGQQLPPLACCRLSEPSTAPPGCSSLQTLHHRGSLQSGPAPQFCKQAGKRRDSSQLITFPTSLQDKPPPPCSQGCHWPCHQRGAPGPGDEVLHRACPAGLPRCVDAVCCASPASQVPGPLRLMK